MSNSTTNLDLLVATQANKEATANALFDAFSPAGIWGRRALATTGLTWGYYGGQYTTSSATQTVANGTVTLTASATNYVYADNATGAVSVNTTGVPAGKIPLYQIVTGASTVTSYTDMRSYQPAGLPAVGQSLGSLSDVNVTEGPGIDGYSLRWNNATSKWIAVASKLANDSDVAISSPVDGQSLSYSAALSQWVNGHTPYDMLMYFPGVPTGAAIMGRVIVPRAVTVASGASGYASAEVAATAATTLTITRNGTSVGTITFAAGSAAGTVAITSAFTTAAGDIIRVVNQTTADTTLAGISATLIGAR